MKSLSRLLLAVAVIVPPARASAEDEPEKSPLAGATVVVRIQSIDQLLANAKYFAKLADKEEQGNQFIGFVESLISPKKGLVGIDTKSPIGLSVLLGSTAEDSKIVVMLPIADKDTLLDELKTRLSIEAKKGEDGAYSIPVPNSPTGDAFVRFSGKYAFLTVLSRETVAVKNLPKVETLLAGPATSLLSVSANMKGVSPDLKKFAVAMIEEKLQNAKKDLKDAPGKAAAALGEKAMDMFASAVKSVLMETGDVGMSFDVDAAKDEISLSAGMSGTANSQLAKDIAALTGKKSIGSLIADKDAIFSGSIDVGIPESIRKALIPVIEEGLKKAEADAPAEQRELIGKLLKAIEPTLKSGSIDGSFSLIGPDKAKHLTLMIAGRVAKGKGIETAVKEAVGTLPGEIQNLFALDASKVGEISLHEFKISGVPDKDEKFEKTFGKTSGWFALKDDALVLGVGSMAKESVGMALKKPTDAMPLASFSMSVARFAPLMEDGKAEKAVEVAKKLFKGDDDKMRLTVEGGSSLKLKFAMSGKVLTFFAKIGEEDKK